MGGYGVSMGVYGVTMEPWSRRSTRKRTTLRRLNTFPCTSRSTEPGGGTGGLYGGLWGLYRGLWGCMGALRGSMGGCGVFTGAYGVSMGV